MDRYDYDEAAEEVWDKMDPDSKADSIKVFKIALRSCANAARVQAFEECARVVAPRVGRHEAQTDGGRGFWDACAGAAETLRRMARGEDPDSSPAPEQGEKNCPECCGSGSVERQERTQNAVHIFHDPCPACRTGGKA